MTTVLKAQDVTVGYGSNIAVDKVSLDVQEGDIMGIVGPNGAGKTTLFRAVLGLQSYRGTIRLFSYDQNEHQSLIPLIGYVPQKQAFEPNFPASVYDVVSMGVISDSKTVAGTALVQQQCFCCSNLYRKIDKLHDRVAKVLDTVGLRHLKDRRIGELSGGELQRVFIAKALIKDPLFILMDEPVTGVDVDAQAKFYDLIRKINRENHITVMWSSHDLDAIKKYANRIACMNGRLFFHGEKDTFFSDRSLLKTYAEAAMQMHMHHDHAR